METGAKLETLIYTEKQGEVQRVVYFFKRIYLIGNPEFKILEVIHEIYVFWVEEQFCFYKIFTKMLRLEVRRKLSKL